MMRGFLHHPWAFWFGILGNIISFMVFLAPLPTFRRVYKKKTTEGFQSLPYVVALFSAKLWIFYALIKTNSYLLITINSIGCFIESIYIIMYFIYAPKKAKILTAKLFVLLDVLIFGAIVALSMLLSKGSKRVIIVGWICMCLSISVFIAPLSIIRLVVRTKSVEFMPFFLSLFLTLSAVVWFFYGLLTEDIYVTVPNVLGFIFGIIQMALYLVYKRKKVKEEIKESDHVIDIPKLRTPSRLEVQQIDANSMDIQDVKEIIAGEEMTDRVPCKNEIKEGQGKIEMPQNHKEKVKAQEKLPHEPI